MTNPFSDESIRSAFAEFRTAEQGRVTPPGVTVARHTVRRRRLRAAGGGAVAAVLALAGAGYLTSTVAAEPGPGGVAAGPAPATRTSPPSPATPPTNPPSPTAPPSSEPPDPGAVNDTGGENEAEERALAATDWGIHDQTPVGSRYNTFFIDPDEPPWSRALFDTHTPRIETERYLVRVWCGEQTASEAEVRLRAGDAEATTTARCAMTEEEVRAGVGETVLEADSSQEISLAVEFAEPAWTDGARPIVSVVAIPQDVDLPERPGPD